MPIIAPTGHPVNSHSAGKWYALLSLALPYRLRDVAQILELQRIQTSSKAPLPSPTFYCCCLQSPLLRMELYSCLEGSPDYQEEPPLMLRPQRLSDPEVASPDFGPHHLADASSHVSAFLGEKAYPPPFLVPPRITQRLPTVNI